MVGGDVQHRADVAEAVAEAGADDAAARGLDHRHVDHRVAQHHAGRHRPGHVALHRDVAVDVDRVGRGLADDVAGHLQHVRQHPRRRGLAVGAGQRRDRDARRAAGREQHLHHRAADVAALALGGRDVHAHARAGVDLADRAAGVAVALGDVGGQEIDAADVEPDGADRPLGHQLVVGVDDVGHVDRGAAGREVGGLAQVDDLALGRHAVVVVALRGQQPVGGVVELEPGQHVLVAGAAARVLVHLLDQLGDRAACRRRPTWPGIRRAAATSSPLTTSSRWSSPRIMLSTTTPLPSLIAISKASATSASRGQVHRDAAAVVAVDRLHHHRVADGVGGIDRVLGVADVVLLRHRQAEVGEQPGAELLVRGDLDGDVRGLAGVSAASIRFWYLPWPTWIRLASFSRTQGMSRASAARTSASAEGPSARRAGVVVEVGDRLGDVEVVVVAGAISSRMMLRATSPASSPTSSDS